TAATALLDARELASTPGYRPPDMRHRTRAALRKIGEDALLGSLVESMHERHKRFGDSVYLLEPNLKMGLGGLRDLQAIGWAAAVLFDLPNLSSLVDVAGVLRIEAHRVLEAYDFIMCLRH